MFGLSPHSFGLSCALLNMIVYGLSPVAIKHFMGDFDPLLFSGIASLIGALPLFFSLNAAGKRQIFSEDFRFSLLSIALLSGIANGLFFVGTSLTSAMNTGLLEQIEPIYALLLAAVFLKEHISKISIVATLIMVSGALSVAYRGYAGINPGDLMILFAPLLFQSSHLVAKNVLPRVSHVFIVPSSRLLFGGVGLCSAAALIHPENLVQLSSLNFWINALVFGLIFRTVDLMLWYTALKHVKLSTVSSLLPLGAAVSFLAAMFFLGEVAGANHYLGFTLILCGLIVLLKMEHQTPVVQDREEK